MKTIIHLVRHGKVYNPGRILYGRLPDYHLSERGRHQAAAVGVSFRGHDVAYIVASPLERTRETASIIASKMGYEGRLDVDPYLIEAGNDLQGLRVNAWNSQLWNPRRWSMLRAPRIPSWGEPYDDIAARMFVAIERARRECEGHEGIVVTHQLPIVCVQRALQELPLYHNPMCRQCAVASVTSLIFDGDCITDMYYSEPAQAI